jgi:hypothetical protein
VIGDTRDSLFLWIGSKKERDLIGHVNHIVVFHG